MDVGARQPSWLETVISATFRLLPVKHGAHRLLDRANASKWASDGGLVSVNYAGHHLRIDSSDLVGWHFLILRNFDPEVAETLLRYAANGGTDVFWDVGANQGACSYAIASRLRRCKVVAIEPQKKLQGILEHNLRCLAEGRFELHSFGVSDQRGQFELFIPEDNKGAATMRAGIVAPASLRETVEVLTATDIKERSRFGWPSLIKIDVEGMEPSVIRALIPAFESQAVRCCVFECHPSENLSFKEIRHSVEQFGYVMYAIRKTAYTTRLVPTRELYSSAMDYAIIRSDLT